jgi:hypothetical protein
MTSSRSKCVATDTNSHGLIDRFMTGAVVRSNFSRGVWKDKIYPMTIFVGDIISSAVNEKKSIDTLWETFNLPQSHFWSFLVQFKDIWIFRLIRIEIITYIISSPHLVCRLPPWQCNSLSSKSLHWRVNTMNGMDHVLLTPLKEWCIANEKWAMPLPGPPLVQTSHFFDTGGSPFQPWCCVVGKVCFPIIMLLSDPWWSNESDTQVGYSSLSFFVRWMTACYLTCQYDYGTKRSSQGRRHIHVGR